jgi:hypothetical protein
MSALITFFKIFSLLALRNFQNGKLLQFLAIRDIPGTSLLRPNTFLNHLLKLCGLNQWLLQPIPQLLGQPVNDFHVPRTLFTCAIRGAGLEIEGWPDISLS